MIVVAGATGGFGSEVARLLHERGVPLRAMARSAERAGRLRALGVEVAVADLAEPASVRRALGGATHAFLTTRENEHMASLERSFLALAREAGVEHLVRISAVGADAGSARLLERWHGELEREIEASGMSYCHVRSHYCSNNLVHLGPVVTWSHTLYLPFAEARVAVTDHRDVAAVAVEALLDERHRGCSHLVTGPEALTGAEIAERLGGALGRNVAYGPIDLEGARRLLAQVFSPWAASARLEIYEHFRNGGGAVVTDTVERLTGRAARRIEEFVRDHARVFGGAVGGGSPA
jgi:uncharacterized protein YbjT (DUF2867 family)